MFYRWASFMKEMFLGRLSPTFEGRFSIFPDFLYVAFGLKVTFSITYSHLVLRSRKWTIKIGSTYIAKINNHDHFFALKTW